MKFASVAIELLRDLSSSRPITRPGGLPNSFSVATCQPNPSYTTYMSSVDLRANRYSYFEALSLFFILCRQDGARCKWSANHGLASLEYPSTYGIQLSGSLSRSALCSHLHRIKKLKYTTTARTMQKPTSSLKCESAKGIESAFGEQDVLLPSQRKASSCFLGVGSFLDIDPWALSW